MRWAHTLRLRLRSIFRRARVEDDLDRELRFHFDQQVEENLAAGMPPAQARHAARRTFGNITRIQEECEDAYGVRLLDDFRHDVAYASRTLIKTPGFIVAVTSLALAIGATTAVTSTVDWMLNRSPGSTLDPDRVVAVRLIERERPDVQAFTFTVAQLTAFRQVQDIFVDVAASGKLIGVVSNDTGADQVVFEYVTGNYFDLLGVRPVIGRVLTPDDDTAGTSPMALLSYDFWQSRFGGDPGVLDTPVRLNGHMSRVVGVLPKRFEGYRLDWNGPTSVWVPLHAIVPLGSPTLLSPATSFFWMMARLRPGTTAEVARQRTQALLPQLPQNRTGTSRPDTVIITPGSEMRIGFRQRPMARTFLGLLFTVSGLILLAACFNIANFLIGRTVQRRRELALRAALGASRARIIRQLLTEAAILGTSAITLGVFAGMGFARLLSPLPAMYLSLTSRTTPLNTPAMADTRMVTVALTLGVASALLFGLLPALLASVRDPMVDLKNPKPHWTWSGMRLTVRQGVLVLQVALAVTLAVTAGLYLRSFARVASVSSDYANPESVLVTRLSLPESGGRAVAFYRALLSRLNTDPEVVSATIGWNPPYMGGSNRYSIPGKDDVVVQAGSTAAAPRFFETHGVAIVRGREFTDSEDDLRSGVVINRVLAAQLWGTDDPIGQTVKYGAAPRIVLGVAADDHCNDLLDDPHPCGWQPFPMATSSASYLRIRTRNAPMAFVPALKAVIREINPDVAIAEETTLSGSIASLTGTQRTAAFASSGLALFGILLVAIGCLSLFQSMVKDSVKEIAIRMALGATPGRITRRIVAQGVVLTVAGGMLGLVAARVLALRVAGQLYRTDATDPLTFIAVPLLVVGVAVVTIGYAALLATRTDPARHLQGE